ncbi:MAG: N-acylneuraminate-9-phosphate synthase [Candidatus Woesebacteria bacterium GW2011_GWA1_38_8]|uniref:N-acylneuraminate-9-phosphate synthase n=1 Tax=Candidatus Woesebacteria bacterium GW2011_GWA1_38_8 TaxID=1618547 RepID=A0A0G0KTK0_9BACT|nr:MAG: N-acylneuraminate-9-phosphate synthase [Candidatus Woesebacteria bacterium GW2011_GWA1_38_8]
MNIFQTKSSKLHGTNYKEIVKHAKAEFAIVEHKSKRKPYIRSAYFNKQKVFFDFFWMHLFQKREPDLAVPEAQKSVIRDTPWGKMTYLDYKKRIEFGKVEYDYIDKYCKEKPIDWTASVWDVPSLKFILNYNVPFIKIPSAKLTDVELLTEAAKSGVPLVVSTGMSTMEEAQEAITKLNGSIVKTNCEL